MARLSSSDAFILELEEEPRTLGVPSAGIDQVDGESSLLVFLSGVEVRLMDTLSIGSAIIEHHSVDGHEMGRAQRRRQLAIEPIIRNRREIAIGQSHGLVAELGVGKDAISRSAEGL